MRNKFKAVVVINEFEPVFGEGFAGAVKNRGGLLHIGLSEGALVRNPRGANELHADGFGFGDYLVEIVDEQVVVEQRRNGPEAETGERVAELGRAHPIGSSELNFNKTEVAGELQAESYIGGED